MSSFCFLICVIVHWVLLGRAKETTVSVVSKVGTPKADGSEEEEVAVKSNKKSKGADKEKKSKSKSKTPKKASKGEVTVHLTQGTVCVVGVGLSCVDRK